MSTQAANNVTFVHWPPTNCQVPLSEGHTQPGLANQLTPYIRLYVNHCLYPTRRQFTAPYWRPSMEVSNLEVMNVTQHDSQQNVVQVTVYRCRDHDTSLPKLMTDGGDHTEDSITTSTVESRHSFTVNITIPVW